ncbi:MAG: potassium/proton antiporter [Roseburia sp.]
MAITLLLVALVLFLCLLADKFSGKFGMPALILFMGIGMLFGSDGIFHIPFDNYEMASDICSVALIFIMFYGGFNTKWSVAGPVAKKAVVLSTLGVVVTAGLTAVFCYFALGFSFADSFLTGAVLSSTDAASVFAVLRKKNLNLKEGTASLLEIESGSNDPVAYLLTIVGISVKMGEGIGQVPWMLFSQMAFGTLLGIATAVLGILVLERSHIVSEGLDTIFMIGLIFLAFGVSELVGGNAYLCVYLMGIILGNSRIRGKGVLVPFFDGITTLAQIIIFFLLGLLSFPHELPQVFLIAFAITVFLALVARPLAVFLLLKPFRCSTGQCLMVSWAGLRGASSIVFAIMVIAGGAAGSNDLFHIVFMVALLSVAVQGTLLPWAAEKFHMVDDQCDVRKTFNDYQEESAITLMRMYIPQGHNWENKKISEVSMPVGSLALMIRRGGSTVIPKGDTVILAEDNVILSVPSYEPSEKENLQEEQIGREHPWCNRTISELDLPRDVLIALVKRGSENLIPDGKTRILEGDIVVTYR